MGSRLWMASTSQAMSKIDSIPLGPARALGSTRRGFSLVQEQDELMDLVTTAEAAGPNVWRTSRLNAPVTVLNTNSALRARFERIRRFSSSWMACRTRMPRNRCPTHRRANGMLRTTWFSRCLAAVNACPKLRSVRPPVCLCLQQLQKPRATASLGHCAALLLGHLLR